MQNQDPLPHSAPNCKLTWTQPGALATPRALSQGSMIERLHGVRDALPDLLKRPEEWRTLDIDHCIPRVERIFRKCGDLWIALHCIHPCNRDDALLHPHPWPSAMWIAGGGAYEMGVGYGAGRAMPPIAATIVLKPGSEYEMVDPDGWHYVRPIGSPSFSLMVTGEKWQRSAPKNSEALKELSLNRKLELMGYFQSRCSEGTQDP